MQAGAITSYIDVAQLTLYAFWIFFAGLIFYLRTEDKREGYPLVSERSGPIRVQGFPPIPKPKVFLLANGGTQLAPRIEAQVPIPHAVSPGWPGSPLRPTGDPLLAGVGPGSYVHRPDVPDLIHGSGTPKIVPLRAAAGYWIDPNDPDPRGMTVVGADGIAAGTVLDLWLDSPDEMVRYLEVELAAGLDPTIRNSVLVPITMALIDAPRRRVSVKALTAAQLTHIPRIALPDQVTMLEEDRITGFVGGGTLYATAARQEPLI